jgi:hypothetical protein
MSKSGDERPADDPAGERLYVMSAEEVDQFIVSLTVIQGYVQLIRRRVLRTPTSRREDLVHALERIDRASHDMTSELWDIIGARASPLDEDDPD